ncbi:putative transmembrane protein, partial [Gregarina niphandrodes]
MLLPTAILGTLMWTLTLFSYLLITIEFRSGRYEEYTVEDWLLIETPFALQLGWETFLALLGWNVWSVKLTHSTGLATPAIELSAFIVSVALVVQAAVLFAGLPMVMNPWLHVGLAWGCGWVAVRWLRNRQNDITVACGLSALAACITCLFYFLVSLAIMCQSKFCLPEIVEPNLDARATAAVRDRGGCTDRGGCNDRGGYSERGAYMERGGYSEPASSALPTANGLPNANGLLHQSYRQSGFNSPSLPHSPH